MEGRIVTNEQAEQLQGTFIYDDTFLNFCPDINGFYFLFLSQQDEIDLENTQYAYLLEIPLTPFVAPPPPMPF
jgi:hypothetical protein